MHVNNQSRSITHSHACCVCDRYRDDVTELRTKMKWENKKIPGEKGMESEETKRGMKYMIWRGRSEGVIMWV